jgi:hypothetical protein
MNIERDDLRQRLVVRGTGTITVDDLRAVVDYQYTQEIWDYALLYDVRGARTTLTAGELRTLATYVERLRPETRGPVAIVTTDATFFGMARMYSVFAETSGMRFTVFRTMSDADEWLTQQSRADN